MTSPGPTGSWSGPLFTGSADTSAEALFGTDPLDSLGPRLSAVAEEHEGRAEEVRAEERVASEFAEMRAMRVGAAEGSTYSIGTPSDRDILLRLVGMMEQSNRRNEDLMLNMLRRMERLEGQRQPQPMLPGPGVGVGNDPLLGACAGCPPGLQVPGDPQAGVGQGQVPNFGNQAVPPPPPQREHHHHRRDVLSSEGKLPYGVTMPTPDFKSWKTRHSELLGYRAWLESFLSWLALMSDVYPAEVKEALQMPTSLPKIQLSSDQQIRGLRLLSFLRQCFSSFPKVEGIINHYVNTTQEGHAHGYEAFRRLHHELSLQSRAEVMSFRDQTLKFYSKETAVTDIIRSVDVELHQFDMLLSDWNIPSSIPRHEALAMRAALSIPEADRTMILLRSLPEHVRVHITLFHRGSMERYADLRQALNEYDLNTRVFGDVSGKLAAMDDKGKAKGKGKDKGKAKGKGSEEKGKGKGKQAEKGKGKSKSRSNSQESRNSKGGKGKTGKQKPLGPCFHCSKEGHLKRDCPELKKKGDKVKFADGTQAQPESESEIYGVLTSSLSSSSECAQFSAKVSFLLPLAQR